MEPHIVNSINQYGINKDANGANMYQFHQNQMNQDGADNFSSVASYQQPNNKTQYDSNS
jgi:hypothetical protein